MHGQHTHGLAIATFVLGLLCLVSPAVWMGVAWIVCFVMSLVLTVGPRDAEPITDSANAAAQISAELP